MLVLEGYAEGRPVLRHLCLRCVTSAERPLLGERKRMVWHDLAGLAGMVLCIVGLFGDYLVPAAHAGFGWHQQVGVAAGAFILVIGLMLRTEVVALAGAFLLGASLGADWFGLTRGPGIGWKQQLLIAIGLAGLLTAGLGRKMMAIRGLKRAAPLEHHERASQQQVDDYAGLPNAKPAAAR